jgi:prohibitin 1
MQSTNGTGINETPRKTRHALEEEARQKLERSLRKRRHWKRRWFFLKYGTPTVILLCLFAAFVFFFRHRMLVTVGSGEVGVIFYRLCCGTSDTVAQEGLHIIAPWDRAYIYSIRTQTLVLPMTVLSQNGLEVHLDAQIRFHPFPDTIPYLHRRLGPDYVKTAMIPLLTEAIQRKIGQFQPEDIYSSSSGNGLFQTDKRVIGGVFIDVEDIALFNIKLPEKVQQSIQAKAEEQQAVQTAALRVDKQQQEFLRVQKEVAGLQSYEKVAGIPKSVLIWKGIEATAELAKSPNSKIIVFGSRDNLPLMLGNVPDLAEK